MPEKKTAKKKPAAKKQKKPKPHKAAKPAGRAKVKAKAKTGKAGGVKPKAAAAKKPGKKKEAGKPAAKKKTAKAKKGDAKIKAKLGKKWKPVFRGRFGIRASRRKSKAKWNKWRYPRGADICKRKDDGCLPRSGYRTAKEVRFMHPSGFRELRVFNKNDITATETGFAVRIAAGIGRKKKKEIREEAAKRGLRVLNP